jgi:integrase
MSAGSANILPTNDLCRGRHGLADGIITAAQYQLVRDALPDDVMRLLVETDIESGLRWGELTELRVRDLDLARRPDDLPRGRPAHGQGPS